MNHESYEETAKRLIIKYGRPWMLYDDEAIGEVIYTYLNAKSKWNPEIAKFSTYLINSIKKKMITMSIQRKRYYGQNSKLVETKDIRKFNSSFNDILDSSKSLSELEKFCLIRRFQYNDKLKDIASVKGVTKQHISETIKSGLRKLKDVLDVLV